MGLSQSGFYDNPVIKNLRQPEPDAAARGIAAVGYRCCWSVGGIQLGSSACLTADWVSERQTLIANPDQGSQCSRGSDPEAWGALERQPLRRTLQ